MTSDLVSPAASVMEKLAQLSGAGRCGRDGGRGQGARAGVTGPGRLRESTNVRYGSRPKTRDSRYAARVRVEVSRIGKSTLSAADREEGQRRCRCWTDLLSLYAKGVTTGEYYPASRSDEIYGASVSKVDDLADH